VTSGSNFFRLRPNTNSDNFLIKVDHHFNDRFSLSGRYVFGDGSQTFPLTSGNGSPLPAYQTVVPTRIQLIGLNLWQVLSKTLVNETRVGYNRFVQSFTPLDANFDPSSIGLVTASQSNPAPRLDDSAEHRFTKYAAHTNRNTIPAPSSKAKTRASGWPVMLARNRCS
jgi:hypothetical protein